MSENNVILRLLFGGKTDVSNRRIKQAIMADPQNTSYTELEIEPLFAAPTTARINIARATRDLQWTPAFSFEDGMACTLDWYRNNAAWLEEVQSGAYRRFMEKWYAERQS